MTTRIRLSLVVACMIASFAVPGFAQSDPRGRSHTLYGTVEGIYDSAQTIRVKQKTIEGFSDARTATYHVDDATILKKLELDDQIVATIYEKDDVLYNIRVARIDDRVRPLKQ